MTSWAFPVVQGFEHRELRRATLKSSTRGSVSVKSRHEPVPLLEGQSASRPERHVSAEAQVSPTQACPCLSFCGVFLLLSSSVFPCWFPGSCLEAGSAQLPLRPSERLARVVVPHLLIAVRLPPTREGSGTKSSGRRPKNRASFRYPPTVSLYLCTGGMSSVPFSTSRNFGKKGLNSDLSQSRASFEIPVTSRASVEERRGRTKRNVGPQASWLAWLQHV